MPVLELNKPLVQREATLVVENPLAPGVHRFSLVVVNDRGVASEPDVVSVTVRRALVIDPIRPPIDRIDRIDTPLRPRGARRKHHGAE